MALPEVPRVVLVGNPNTGKTTLFNRLTGARGRVGNYPGITVERSVGRASLNATTAQASALVCEVEDVPGCYSLASRSAEEQIAIDALLGRHDSVRPDVAVVVVDATNLERNLYLTLQVLELGRPTLVALNQMDALREAAGEGPFEVVRYDVEPSFIELLKARAAPPEPSAWLTLLTRAPRAMYLFAPSLH
jgi:ferrous iron transport protein B